MTMEIYAQVKAKTLKAAPNLFSNDPLTRIRELVQNARRAGATEIKITIDDSNGGANDIHDVTPIATFSISDNGRGIPPDQFEALLVLGESAWSEDIQRRENSAGMGFFSLGGLSSKIVIESGTTRMTINKPRDVFSGKKPAIVDTDALTTQPVTGTRITWQERNTRQIAESLGYEFRVYPVKVVVNYTHALNGEYVTAERTLNQNPLRTKTFFDSETNTTATITIHTATQHERRTIVGSNVYFQGLRTHQDDRQRYIDLCDINDRSRKTSLILEMIIDIHHSDAIEVTLPTRHYIQPISESHDINRLLDLIHDAAIDEGIQQAITYQGKTLSPETSRYTSVKERADKLGITFTPAYLCHFHDEDVWGSREYLRDKANSSADELLVAPDGHKKFMMVPREFASLSLIVLQQKDKDIGLVSSDGYSDPAWLPHIPRVEKISLSVEGQSSTVATLTLYEHGAEPITKKQYERFNNKIIAAYPKFADPTTTAVKGLIAHIKTSEKTETRKIPLDWYVFSRDFNYTTITPLDDTTSCYDEHHVIVRQTNDTKIAQSYAYSLCKYIFDYDQQDFDSSPPDVVYEDFSNIAKRSILSACLGDQREAQIAVFDYIKEESFRFLDLSRVGGIKTITLINEPIKSKDKDQRPRSNLKICLTYENGTKETRTVS
jgi:hypothetical protein